MSSPYSTTLLQQPVEEAAGAVRPAAPRVEAPSRSVTHVTAPAPMPMLPAPQPVYVVAGRSGASAVSAVMLGLVVLLVGVVALVGSYFAVRSLGPTAQEAVTTRQVAMRDGFRAGRERGIEAGRTQALQLAGSEGALRTAIARQRAYDASYQRGLRQGRDSYRPARSYGYAGPDYRIDWGRGFDSSAVEVAAARGYAQELSMATNSAVELEIY